MVDDKVIGFGVMLGIFEIDWLGDGENNQREVGSCEDLHNYWDPALHGARNYL